MCKGNNVERLVILIILTMSIYYEKKLRIAVSPLTNKIFAGKTLKSGTWQNVTMDCLNAVAEHVKKFGKPVEITNADTGELIYKITVE